MVGPGPRRTEGPEVCTVQFACLLESHVGLQRYRRETFPGKRVQTGERRRVRAVFWWMLPSRGPLAAGRTSVPIT